MLGAALAILGAVAVGARALYPLLLERRAARRRVRGADGIIVGAATIERRRDNAPGVLLLHGGGDTPQVLEGLAGHLYDRGFSVRAPLLGGHGRSLADFATASSAEWHRQVEDEYERMQRSHRWVSVVGLSMGGALALKFAAQRAGLPALVLLAPYIDMPTAIKRIAATSEYWGWLLPYFASGGGRSIHDPVAAEQALGHGVFTPNALRALYEVMTEATTALPLIQSPTLVIQSKEDNRIAAASAERAFARLGAREKRLIWTEGAGHVITVDYGRERVFELVAEWLTAHPREKRPAVVPAGPLSRQVRL